MTDEFVLAGGTDLVVRWIEELVMPAPGPLLWAALDNDIRLALVQGWMMYEGYDAAASRDAEAAAIAHPDGRHPLHAEFLPYVVDHWRGVYSMLDGRPAIVGMTDLVDIDMELVVVTSFDQAEPEMTGKDLPVHSFITRLVGGEWKIAAMGRRLPKPGWPPTQTDPVTRPEGFS